MRAFVDNLFAAIWNTAASRLSKRRLPGGLKVGVQIIDGKLSGLPVYLPEKKRCEHIVILGKTGCGKSSFLRSLCAADIRAGRGFVYFDHHGDTTPALLSMIAAEEKRSGRDLSEKLIVIRPADPDWVVGFNPLTLSGSQRQFVEIAGITSVLKDRWGLTHLGAQTEEVLRNSLHVLADNTLTLLEMSALLSNSSFRSRCLKRVRNDEVREYFEDRFEPLSEAMKATFRNPVLNKLSEFVSDIHFRHILGQAESTFSFADALENDKWVLIDLSKGKLGKHSSTLASLLFSQLISAVFCRHSRKVFSLYCDEIQNLVAADTDIETLLAEARKFAVSVVTANQFLDQFPKTMRSAIQAVGTHIGFQVSAEDAPAIAAMLGGGKSTAEILKSLPFRHFLIRHGSFPFVAAKTLDVDAQKVSSSDLLTRALESTAKRREDVEREIRMRKPARKTSEENLNDWE